MKALIIADNETVVKKIQDALENNGCDTIVYRWLLKALDNVIEIAPDVTVISAFDYPRHWKILVQFENAILEKKPVIILFRPEDISKEEIEKEIALGVKGYISELDEAGLNKLKSLLENFQDGSADQIKKEVETVSEIEAVPAVDSEEAVDEVPTVDSLLGSEFVEQNSGMIESAGELLESLALPTVDNLFTEESDGYLPTVDEINHLDCDEPYGITLKLEKNVTEECVLPDVDKVLDALPELPENVIPTVDDIYNRLNVSLIDIPETEAAETDYEMKMPETDVSFSPEHEGSFILFSSEDHCTAGESSQVETERSEEADNLEEKEYEPDGENSELSPALTEALSVQLEPAVIPSVDRILDGGQNLKITRKHSLLARILEMYGE